jgi:hypothetical protein
MKNFNWETIQGAEHEYNCPVHLRAEMDGVVFRLLLNPKNNKWGAWIKEGVCWKGLVNGVSFEEAVDACWVELSAIEYEID